MVHYFPQIYRVITAGTFLLGLFFMFRAVTMFKEYAAMRSMMSSGQSQTHIGPPLMNLVVALALLYWPAMTKAFIITFYGSPLITPYSAYFSPNPKIETAVNIVRIIGFYAFVRGWVLLARSASQGAQPGTATKALFHLVGGILAINIIQTVHAFLVTFNLA